MKARALKKRLNTTRTIQLSGGKVCISSAYIHDLIHYRIATKTVHFALDSKDAELQGLYQAMKEMAESGEILQYVDGEDELSVRIPVYSTDDDGNVVESFTDEFGWPNVTAAGVLMYDNSHFKTQGEAIEHGIRNAKAGVKLTTQSINQDLRHLAERQKFLEENRRCLRRLKRLARSLKPNETPK